MERPLGPVMAAHSKSGSFTGELQVGTCAKLPIVSEYRRAGWLNCIRQAITLSLRLERVQASAFSSDWIDGCTCHAGLNLKWYPMVQI
ncbi:hypothetical protein GCM10010987_44740 [Bradyrhizobium guangdongense]|uniref:Uncharacterized protein n=1 Tax=Bradyrhizobium guangdongense TaxID=1325090 RepID=A0AA87W649_9BRAD|nr:hypothetical protein GCM10010987_44740 [Bradyrhizobium guangdongense]